MIIGESRGNTVDDYINDPMYTICMIIIIYHFLLFMDSYVAFHYFIENHFRSNIQLCDDLCDYEILKI